MKLIILLGAAAGSFFILTKVLGLGVLLSIFLALAVLIALSRIISTLVKKRSAGIEKIVGEKEYAQSQISEGVKKLTAIRNMTRMIPNNEAAKKIQEICKTGMEIFDYIKKNPGNLKKAKMFINYYLDTTEKIIIQYAELAKRSDLTDDMKKTLADVEATLDSMRVTYKKQLTSLFEDDILDLNTEISVLKKTIKLES